MKRSFIIIPLCLLAAACDVYDERDRLAQTVSSQNSMIDLQASENKRLSKDLAEANERVSELNTMIITHMRGSKCDVADLDATGQVVGLRRKFGPGCP